MKSACSKHAEGTEQINRVTKDSEKARGALMMSDKHPLTSENKMDGLTIKQLIRKNPVMAQKFKDVEKTIIEI